MTSRGPSHRAGFFRHDTDAAVHYGAASQPTLITSAEESLEAQRRARVRRYTILMAFRIPALLLAGIAYGIWGNGLVALLIVAASIPLPWIAVLVANDRPPRKKGEPSRYDGRRRTGRREIEAPAHPTIEG